jgi:hypothetical protein
LCEAKLAGKEIKVNISEGHPLTRCLVTVQFATSGLPWQLTDGLLNEETGVRLNYLGDDGVILDGVGEFTTEIFLTTDLPEGSKLQNIGWEFVFQPAYFTD